MSADSAATTSANSKRARAPGDEDSAPPAKKKCNPIFASLLVTLLPVLHKKANPRTLHSGMPIRSKCGSKVGQLLVNGDSCKLSGDFAAIWELGGKEFEFAQPLTRQDFEAAEKED